MVHKQIKFLRRSSSNSSHGPLSTTVQYCTPMPVAAAAAAHLFRPQVEVVAVEQHVRLVEELGYELLDIRTVLLAVGPRGSHAVEQAVCSSDSGRRGSINGIIQVTLGVEQNIFQDANVCRQPALATQTPVSLQRRALFVTYRS